MWVCVVCRGPVLFESAGTVIVAGTITLEIAGPAFFVAPGPLLVISVLLKNALSLFVA